MAMPSRWVDEENSDEQQRDEIISDLRAEAAAFVNRYHRSMLVVGGGLLAASSLTCLQSGNLFPATLNLLGISASLYAHYHHRRLRLPLTMTWTMALAIMRYFYPSQLHWLIFDGGSLLYGWVTSTEQVSMDRELDLLEESAKRQKP